MDQDRQAPLGQIQTPGDPLDAPRLAERVRLVDSPVRGADLHESIRDTLRAVARTTRRDGTNGVLDERSRQALHIVCELARGDKVRVEQLLVLLKDAWRSLPEVQSVACLDADVTLASVITHCIEEYFRPSRRN